MRPRLREVAHQAPRPDIVFLGQEADVVANPEQSAKERPGVRAASYQTVVVGEPETGRQKSAFRLTGRGAALMTHDKALLKELLLDAFNRCDYARVLGRKKPDERKKKKAGVNFVRAIRLSEVTKTGIKAKAADVFVDFAANRPPLVEWSVDLQVLRAAYGTIERDPGHDFGVGEMAFAPADLPDSVVGLPPNALEVLDERDLKIEMAAVFFDERSGVIQGVGKLSVDIEL